MQYWIGPSGKDAQLDCDQVLSDFFFYMFHIDILHFRTLTPHGARAIDGHTGLVNTKAPAECSVTATVSGSWVRNDLAAVVQVRCRGVSHFMRPLSVTVLPVPVIVNSRIHYQGHLMVTVAAAAALVTVDRNKPVRNGPGNYRFAVHVSIAKINPMSVSGLGKGVCLDITPVIITVVAALNEPPIIPCGRVISGQAPVYPFRNGSDDSAK
jgi:hypothetical protein